MNTDSWSTSTDVVSVVRCPLSNTRDAAKCCFMGHLGKVEDTSETSEIEPTLLPASGE